MKIFHQLGHNHIWNLDSYSKDSVGDGFIISPVNLKPEKIKKVFSKELLENSFFDPQCYLLEGARDTLKMYPYFSTVLDEGLHSLALDTIGEDLANKCVDFQLEYPFQYIVIPTMYSGLVLNQRLKRTEDIFINPFLKKIRETDLGTKEVFLTVIIHEDSLASEDHQNYLLNWITQFPEIDGIYLIPSTSFQEPISNQNFIFNFLKFLHSLKNTGLKIIIGYCGIESFIYSAALPDGITMGIYKNLRNFSTQRFLEEKLQMKSPNPRVFSKFILNWPLFDKEALFWDSVEDINSLLFGNDKYDFKNFFPVGKKPHFNNSLLYKHYFYEFNSLCKTLPSSQIDRNNFLLDYIRTSINKLETLTFIEEKCYNHLHDWENILRAFKYHLEKE